MNHLWPLLVLLALVIMLRGSALAESCYSTCRCTRQADGNVVECDYDATTAPNFTPDPRVKLLDLTANRLKEIPNLSAKFTALSRLILDVNNISTIDYFSMDELKGLERLSLQRNGLKQIHHDTFNNVPFLKFLSLAGNPLQGLFKPGKSIFSSVSLKKLELAACRLAHIPAESFTKLEKLETLDLTGNLLRSLSPAVFAPLGALKRVYLGDNPWKCGTELEALKTALTGRLGDGESLKCVDGGGVTRGWFDAVDEQWEVAEEEVTAVERSGDEARLVGGDDKPVVAALISTSVERQLDGEPLLANLVSNYGDRKPAASMTNQADNEPKAVPLITDDQSKGKALDRRHVINKIIVCTNVALISIICLLSIVIVTYLVRRKRSKDKRRPKDHFYANVNAINGELAENSILISFDSNEPIYETVK